MVAQLDARMLKDYTILGVYEALVVKTDGGAKDKAKIKVLGDHGHRALHVYLDMHIKSEREDSGSSAKRPAADSDAAFSRHSPAIPRLPRGRRGQGRRDGDCQ